MPHALLVDDDTHTLSALSELVAREGFTVAAASTLRASRLGLSREERLSMNQGCRSLV